MIRTLRARVDYGWRHSPQPYVARLRLLLDGELRAAFPGRPVHTGPVHTAGGLRLTYTGPYEIGKGMLAQVARHPDSDAGNSPRATGADLELFAASARRLAALPSARTLQLPPRVHQIVRIREDLETTLGGRCRRERQRFNRNRRKELWTWEHSEAAEDVEFFHRRMHVPTVRARHGADAVSEPLTVARECLFKQGHLFFIRAGGPDGERIAGTLCRWDARRRTLTYRLVGILDGDHALRLAGALTALQFFVFEWAARHGVSTVDLGGGAPFLSRGIVQQKMRLGAEMAVAPVPVRHLRMRLRVARDTEGVRDFLVANPLLATTPGGGLEAVYFHDRTRPIRDDVAWRSPGVDRLRIVDLDEFLDRQVKLDGGSSRAPALPVTVGTSPPTAGLLSTFHEGGRRWHTGRS
ncbi:hypothetical protein OG729_06100 [Streptomyces sp. NBC_00210]|uniref:hypothetical protein n=1 Tax=unclassified Streptomyces TaxID=2593676 RepID=UPI00325576EF